MRHIHRYIKPALLLGMLAVTACNGAPPATTPGNVEPGGGTNPTTPADVAGLTATAGSGEVTLRWTANAENDLKGYLVRWGAGATLDKSQFVAAPAATLNVTGLTNGTGYTFEVRAQTTTGKTSVKAATTTATPVAASGNGAGLLSFVRALSDAPAPPPEKSDATPDNVTSALDSMNGTEVTCVKKDYSLTQNFDEIATFNPNAGVIWPGSLVQGATVPDGIPAAIPLDRGPLTVTALTGGNTIGSRAVDHPSLATVGAAMSDILGAYTGPTAAKISYTKQEGYSFERGMLKLNVNAKWVTGNAKAALDLDGNSERKTLYVKYVQEYYTVATNPLRPDTAFGPGVTTTELARYASNTNLPAYISSVTYGRMLIMKISSSSDYRKMMASIDFAYNGGATSVDGYTKAELESTLRGSSVQIVALGGNSTDGVDVVTSSGDKLGDYLKNGASYSKDSPAYPISYKVEWLKDNTIAKLGASTTYSVRECSPNYQQVDLVLDNFKILKDCDAFAAGDFYYELALNQDGNTSVISSRAAADATEVNDGGTITLDTRKRVTVLKNSASTINLSGWLRDDDTGIGDPGTVYDQVGTVDASHYYPNLTGSFVVALTKSSSCKAELSYHFEPVS
ncbi:thiol-activated cytolysin family protein [Deinococcus pimensis]|uniref:thiol-activated cytolysin family protein n=1 Tax=Deinococcus pimensis TaxID=309888 RepID=UPI0004895B6E|nr:thiol-activated cytolysin family protein [Deinococcus pimensis]